MAAESDSRREDRGTRRRKSMNLCRFTLVLTGIAFGYIHRWHVSTLFENDRHFSHLSEIEREMSFRTEMGPDWVYLLVDRNCDATTLLFASCSGAVREQQRGPSIRTTRNDGNDTRNNLGMYYYYYKIIAESKIFVEGLMKVSHDDISEYGNVINAARKYNLLPELVAGSLYRCAESMGLLSVEKCWQIDRGEGAPPVTSCVGQGVPVYFYLQFVWDCSAFTVIVLFYYAVVLGNSINSGIVAVILFFYNHNECTRVQWTPPLRESFAYPILLGQMYVVTMVLGECTQQDWRTVPTSLIKRMGLLTAASLCCWQFSPFVFTTQIIALLILKWMKIISNSVYRCICIGHAWSILLAMCFTDGTPILHSLYVCLLFTSCVLSFLSILSRIMGAKLQTILEVILTIVGTKCLKSYLATVSEDDAHVFGLLKAKLTGYKDFHTMLYTCSAEFDFLPYRSYEAIIKTLLLPYAVLAGMLALYFWYRNYKTKGYPRCIDADLAYNGLQTGAFIIMAVFIMRLKLFMNTHLCIIAGTVCTNKYLEKFGLKSGVMKGAIVVLLISSMSYHGLQRLQEERSIIGEYSNMEQEELFEWVKSNTPQRAVFAGKMSLMANLMLSTGRPIVNNPYYESKEMRDRTTKVYEIFGRKDVASVYFTLRTLRVGYVILEEPLCFGFANMQAGCQMIDLWDMVDNGTAKAAGKPPVCPILFRGNAYPFKRVFVNNRYVVLQLDYSQYVELKPKTVAPLEYQS